MSVDGGVARSHMIIQQGQSLAFELTTQATILKLLCAFVLCGILVAGLWPFHAPKNEVSWLSNRKGLLFGDYGSIVGAGPFRASEPKEESPCSLEIWLQPTKVNSSGTILGLYWPESRVVPFALRQSLGDLVLQRTSRDQSQHSTKTKIYVDHVFSHATPVFVTISSGERGTSIYANGTLARMSPEFRFSSKDLTGQLVVGNSSVTTDTWSGQLKGLAIYNRELTASQVAKNYRSWSESGHPGVSALDGATALYLFNEDAGNAVHNQVDSTTDLVIPERFFVLHEPFLQRPWNEYRPEWNYWKDIAVNIGGFMPLGFLFLFRAGAKSPTSRGSHRRFWICGQSDHRGFAGILADPKLRHDGPHHQQHWDGHWSNRIPEQSAPACVCEGRHLHREVNTLSTLGCEVDPPHRKGVAEEAMHVA